MKIFHINSLEMRHLIQSYLQNYFYKSNINLKSLKTFNFVENKIRACASMDFLAFASTGKKNSKVQCSIPITQWPILPTRDHYGNRCRIQNHERDRLKTHLFPVWPFRQTKALSGRKYRGSTSYTKASERTLLLSERQIQCIFSTGIKSGCSEKVRLVHNR